MNYRYLKIDTQLRDYVRTGLVFDNVESGKRELPLFTKGLPAFFCKSNVIDQPHHITLFGESVPDNEWNTGNGQIIIVFFFKPFALSTIFKITAATLKENPVDLNLWSAQKTIALNLQLLHAPSTEEKIAVLENLIITQLNANKRDCEIIRRATDRMMENSQMDVLPQLMDELNITERTFQRIFKKYVGITPNEYRRICQFYFSFSQLKGGHFGKVTDVAYENGYFDQSHYIRSFKEFTNTTPNEYLESGLGKKE